MIFDTTILANIPTSDKHLLDSFFEGDNMAFTELYHRHSARLQEYCIRKLADKAAAEDIISSLWEKVIAMRLNPRSIENPAAYFFIITRNLIIATQRERNKMPLTPLDEEANYRQEANMSSEYGIIVEEALERLPLKYKEVLTLQLYCGYKLEEIAKLLDKSADAIYARASRARIMLRKIVAKELVANPRKV